MRNKLILHFATLVFGITFSASHAQTVLSEKAHGQMSDLINALQNVNGTSCVVQTERPALKGVKCEGCDDLLRFTRNQQCDFLLSDAAPDWFLQGEKGSKEWFPVCSDYYSLRSRKLRPDATQEQVATDVRSMYHMADACRPKAELNRYSKSYQAPSQKEMGLNPMTSLERKIYEEQVKTIRNEVSLSCCGLDEACSQLFQEIKPRYCEPQKDPTASDPCINRDHYVPYDGMPGPNEWALPGYLELGAYVIQDKAGAESTLYHEFAHACSSIKRKIKAQKRDPKYREDIMGVILESCKVTPSTLEIYSKLYQQLGYSMDTATCLGEVAENSKKLRFDPGSCENNCPHLYLEESYALLYEHLAMSTHDLLPSGFPRNLCFSVRDPRHPLGADVLKCATYTPSVRTQIEDALECKK